MKPALCILALLLLPLAAAESRPWRNTTGDKSIVGHLISRDEFSLTIMRTNRKPLTIPLEKIHVEDLRWLNKNHPVPPPPPNKPIQSAGVIDDLQFGDSEQQVIAKLKKSKIFEGKMVQTAFGSSGLDGTFVSKQTIGGYRCSLSFRWNQNTGGLTEITLQTTPESASSWDRKFKPCIAELSELISSLHGKPVIAIDTIDLKKVAEDAMFVNYLWHLEPKGSVYLGPAKYRDQYVIAVRFTEETYKPKEEPESQP